jgi:hypothetical protein
MHGTFAVRRIESYAEIAEPVITDLRTCALSAIARVLHMPYCGAGRAGTLSGGPT